MKTQLTMLFLVLSFFIQHIYAQQLSGLDVMKENDKQFKFVTEESTMTMELINSSGKKRIRSLIRYSKRDKNENTSMLIRFLSPADVKGASYLSIEHSANDESRYLYLPALKKVRRVSAGEDSDSFMGSDFTYEDIDEIDFDKYEFKIIGNENFNNENCYKVEVVAKINNKTSGYSKRIYLISKKTFVSQRVDYFDKHNELCKKLIHTDIKPVNASGLYRSFTWTMQDIKTKHKTVLLFQDFKINERIDDNMFSVRNLERIN